MKQNKKQNENMNMIIQLKSVLIFSINIKQKKKRINKESSNKYSKWMIITEKATNSIIRDMRN